MQIERTTQKKFPEKKKKKEQWSEKATKGTNNIQGYNRFTVFNWRPFHI